jgi:predicted phage tail component-like protein
MEKSIFNFKIQYNDGSILDLHERGLWVSYFRIPSLKPTHNTEKIEGGFGSVLTDTTIEERLITTSIQIEADTYQELDSLRDELFEIFNPLESFYIIRDLQPNKRVKVKVSNEFDLEYITLEDGEIEVEFVIHSVFFESIGTTLHPHSSGDLTQVKKLNFGDPPIQYSFHNTNRFWVWNDSTVPIDPTQHEMEIIFKGESSNLRIKNLTTNEEWSYTGNTVDSDVLMIDGIRSYINDETNSIFGQTNKKLISLNKGWNEFEIITGVDSDFTTEFDFRFYYF